MKDCYTRQNDERNRQNQTPTMTTDRDTRVRFAEPLTNQQSHESNDYYTRQDDEKDQTQIMTTDRDTNQTPEPNQTPISDFYMHGILLKEPANKNLVVPPNPQRDQTPLIKSIETSDKKEDMLEC